MLLTTTKAPELSSGGREAAANIPELFKIFEKLLANPYSKDTNPTGILNAGVAINGTIKELLVAKLNTLDTAFVPSDLEYSVPYGTPVLRTEIASTLNRHFAPAVDVGMDDIVVTNGCTSAIEMLAFAMCEPGDHILVPAPLYLALPTDMGTRARAKMTPVHVPLDMAGECAQIAYFERAVHEIARQGGTVKALFLMNPNNPLGITYPRQVMRAFLRFASTHGLFVVSDEIYALSVFNRSASVAPFESLLSWNDLAEYIDPRAVVVLHGLSKDFGLNGFRVGWIVSPWNKELLGAMVAYAPFAFVPSYTQRLLTQLFADRPFIDSLLETSQERLADNYAAATAFLYVHEIEYVQASGGHFIWFRLPISACAKMIRNKEDNHACCGCKGLVWTKEREFDMAMYLMDKHSLYMPPGQAFFSTEFGWFRFTFAICKEELDIALKRLEDCL
ncbi:hypothetical protein IW140_002031 [Coemansia sp. RSA 1813]|nr:hypothetical protein EV178_000358 [Coemansia sp. RSA 1646]KAJ2090540.1 hypothetical protein IW138_002547 [Coemansia sp. RSA 986]KAJ2216372.1 hypothetical protein EV179_001398 [Coemansia sp. RSA 487]KAJ2570843.1 hypothetical protein IW140_002031 [Coemansia sp. RSA 1813]